MDADKVLKLVRVLNAKKKYLHFNCKIMKLFLDYWLTEYKPISGTIMWDTIILKKILRKMKYFHLIL